MPAPALMGPPPRQTPINTDFRMEDSSHPTKDIVDAGENHGDAASLRAKLEDLWTRFLIVLEQYSAAQKSISALCSSGTFSLAQANFKNSTGARYGPGHFDQRMQASTRVKLGEDAGALKVVSDLSLGMQKQGLEQPAEFPTPDEEIQSQQDGRTETSGAQAGDPSTVHNPLKWFGILVPSQLRTCQRNYLELVTTPLSEAVMASRELRRLEVDIRRLRKDIRKAERSEPGAPAK
ncbi:hypothetical protein K461DRAFT_296585 [Myriangium duriaei CBS 260.36]|uniref:Vacuolar ATPase assembly protein VMA22 n=1 Tax=Myriangium duriaei CBS 260.36 TaxID=1168546 RepID=A0A9P4MDP4_9PEZI|nr:hypothetical protein K461DRAFT_296585 [Myriangium duriaei CBS 260.36]